MIKSEFISELSKAKQKKSFHLWNSKSHYFLFFQLSTIIIALISTSLVSHAAEVTLAWDSCDRASGYILYYGLNSRTYENMVDVGNNLQHTVTSLSENQIYYFTVTSYNDYGESEYSTEISYNTAEPAAGSLAYVSQTAGCNGRTPCYTSINTAIIDTQNNGVILITGEDYNEAVEAASVKNLTLSGGWSTDYLVKSSDTTINSLEIGFGSFVTENIVMDGP